MAADGGHNFDLLCPTILTVCSFLLNLLGGASLLNVTAIAVDRLLAITLHLRYRELVTSKRVIIALVSVWLTSGVAAFLYISVNNQNVMVPAAVIEFVCLFLTTVAYINIYRAVRHHHNQMNNQLQHENEQTVDLFREIKSALNAMYFYVIFVACYLPNFCSAILLMTDSTRISFWLAFHVTIFFILLNSSLNPLVYCWRYQEIRQIMKSTVKKILRITET